MGSIEGSEVRVQKLARTLKEGVAGGLYSGELDIKPDLVQGGRAVEQNLGRGAHNRSRRLHEFVRRMRRQLADQPTERFHLLAHLCLPLGPSFGCTHRGSVPIEFWRVRYFEAGADDGQLFSTDLVKRITVQGINLGKDAGAQSADVRPLLVKLLLFLFS